MSHMRPDITPSRQSESYLEAPANALQIAEIIGVRAKRMDDLALIGEVEKGLPLLSVERLARHIDPADKTFAHGIVSRASLHRLRQQGKPLSRELSERVFAIARVFAEAKQTWGGDEDAVRRFLARPHPLLGMRTPYDLARGSSAGAELVVQLLGQARAGVAV